VNEHIDEDLPLILTGEADRATVYAAVGHLRTCPDCTQELLSLLTAHASLSSAARFAPEIVSIPSAASEEPVAGPPDLTAMFASVRAEAEKTERRPRRTTRWLAVAAAVIIVGAGTGVLIDRTTSNSSAQTDVALAAFDVGKTPAKAVVSGGQMKLDATSLPTPPSGELYEVWLTNAQRTSMHALGWIGPNGTGSYTVPATLMNHFSAVEVSVQKVAAPDGYSGTSVLRGTY
jgi:Anti-sigma-K factor rskA